MLAVERIIAKAIAPIIESCLIVVLSYTRFMTADHRFFIFIECVFFFGMVDLIISYNSNDSVTYCFPFQSGSKPTTRFKTFTLVYPFARRKSKAFSTLSQYSKEQHPQ